MSEQAAGESEINRSVLARLREDTGDEDGELVEELVSVFMGEAREIADDVIAASAAGDDPGAMGAAHKLKSGAANLGAEKLRSLCERIEHTAREGRTDEVAQLTSGLDDALSGAVAGLRAYLSEIGRGQLAAS